MLREFLKEQYGLTGEELLPLMLVEKKVTLNELLDKIEERKTEENVICIIQGHSFMNREVVLCYFAGMCERFMMEGGF